VTASITRDEAEKIWNQIILKDELPIRFAFWPDFVHGSPSVDGRWKTQRWDRDRDSFTVYISREGAGFRARVRIVTDNSQDVEVK
jgi:hypothetical protein